MKQSLFFSIKTFIFLLTITFSAINSATYDVTFSEYGELVVHIADNDIADNTTILAVLNDPAENVDVTFYLQEKDMADVVIAEICECAALPERISIKSSSPMDIKKIDNAFRGWANIYCELVPVTPKIDRELTPLIEVILSDEFSDWFYAQDEAIQTQISNRLNRIRVAEDFGATHGVGGDLHELTFNAGCRIYYTRLQANIVNILEAGGKNGQNQQIARLLALLRRK